MCTFLRNYCKNLIIYHRGETVVKALKRHIFCVKEPRRKAVMIRKLKTGEYRLYSKKKDPKTANAGILERSNHGSCGEARA